MAYAAYLRDLLTPLGVYTFAEGSISGGEVESIGAGLDAAAAALEHSERETLLQTAQEEGLSLREALFAKRPAAPTPELRRAAIAALSQIGGDGFTVAAINRAGEEKCVKLPQGAWCDACTGEELLGELAVPPASWRIAIEK